MNTYLAKLAGGDAYAVTFYCGQGVQFRVWCGLEGVGGDAEAEDDD